MFCEIIDVIRTNIEFRFKELPALKFMSLLDSRIFQEFQINFSRTRILLLKNYGNLLDFESL